MKRKELKERMIGTQEEIEKVIKEKLKITYVGHSLGGMVLPMYLIH